MQPLGQARATIGYIYKITWTEVHVRIIPQGDSAWLCADKSAEMRVQVKSEGGLGWSESEVGVYDVRV